jgi:hypothetical protein
LIGKEFVTACLGLIAVSRFGLTEQVLGKCFEFLEIKWDSASFALLRQILAPHFARSEYGEWDFNHRILRSTIRISRLSQEDRDRLNKAIVTSLESSDAPQDIVERDIVCHYFWAYQYDKIAKYIASRQLQYDTKAVKQAFEAFLYLFDNCKDSARGKRLNDIVNILDSTQGLKYEEKLYLVYAYGMQTKGLIRQNLSINYCKVIYKKIIGSALELNDGVREFHYKALIMDIFLAAPEFFIDEGYHEEAQQIFEKFETVKLKFTDLLKNFSFKNVEIVGAVIKNQML